MEQELDKVNHELEENADRKLYLQCAGPYLQNAAAEAVTKVCPQHHFSQHFYSSSTCESSSACESLSASESFKCL